MKNKIKNAILLCILTAFALSFCGCDNGEQIKDDNAVIKYSEISSSEYIESLLEHDNILIGESGEIKDLVCDILPGNNSVVTYDITLNRLVIEYGPTTELDENGKKPEGEENDLTEEEFADIWTYDIIKDVIMYNSTVLFDLVDNLTAIQFLVEGYNVPTFTISRENIESFYGFSLNDITAVNEWNNKITAPCLDSLKVEEFYGMFPLETELHVKTKEEIDDENADLLEQEDEETAEERVKRQMQEQYDKLPDDVQ